LSHGGLRKDNPDIKVITGFYRSPGIAGDIHLALDHTKGRAPYSSSVERDSAYEGANLVDTLVDLGVPYDEAHSYAEGVRRGSALVVVESSDDRAERGMEILRRLHPVNIHERTAQWRQEGWTGYDANALTSTPTSSATTTTRRSQEQAHAETRMADKRAATVPPQERAQARAQRRVEGQEEIAIPVVEEDISIGQREVECGHVRIFSYGCELGTNERYHGRDWAALEADARRDWEARHPSTWERFKDAIRYGWDKVHART